MIIFNYLLIYIVNCLFFLIISISFEIYDVSTEAFVFCLTFYVYIVNKLEFKVNYVKNNKYFYFNCFSIISFLGIWLYLKNYVFYNELITGVNIIIITVLFIILTFVQYFGIVEYLVKKYGKESGV